MIPAEKCKLDNIDYFIVRKSLRLPKRRRVIKVLNDIENESDELACIGVPMLRQVIEQVHVMMLECLWREEGFHQTLHNDFLVCHGFIYVFLRFILENFEGLS